jgi:two-component system sensor kinase FixL
VTSPAIHDATSARGLDAETQLRALLDTTLDAVVMSDSRGRIERFNRAAERLFAYDEQEVVGHDVGMLIPDTDYAKPESYLARCERTDVTGTGRDAVARRRDGTTFPVCLSVGRIGDSDPPRFIGFIRDATAQDEARRAQERLAQVSRLTMLGEMLAGIAHELNQPLAAITTYAHASQRLLEVPDPDIAEVNYALGQIAAQSLRAGDIIRRLRSLAQQKQTRRESHDLNAVVLELRRLIESDARLHGVRVFFDLAPDSLFAELDPAQIQQVLLNLLRNAIEALHDQPPGSREIMICTLSTPDRQVELRVYDNGPGIDPEISQRMFYPFCTTKPAGTGLGLAISHTIAEAHGGKLEHVRREPRGAIFRLTLPSGGASA